MEGFKNTRKGTNIAAQATAISIATKIMERGIKSVRIAVRGLGPGRMVSGDQWFVELPVIDGISSFSSLRSKAFKWVD
jgi:Ribosomal protein S11